MENNKIIHSSKLDIIGGLNTALTKSQNGDMARCSEYMIAVFSKIDARKKEVEINDLAKADIKIEKVKEVTKEGKEVLVPRIVDSRNINFMVKKMGNHSVHSIICLLIANLNEFFNLKHSLNINQVKEISQQIIDEVGDVLFLDELIYIFKKAKTHAKLWNNLDGSIIWSWIDEFLTNRNDQRYNQHVNSKSETYISSIALDVSKNFIFYDANRNRKYEERDLLNAGIPATKKKPKSKKK